MNKCHFLILIFFLFQSPANSETYFPGAYYPNKMAELLGAYLSVDSRTCKEGDIHVTEGVCMPLVSVLGTDHVAMQLAIAELTNSSIIPQILSWGNDTLEIHFVEIAARKDNVIKFSDRSNWKIKPGEDLYSIKKEGILYFDDYYAGNGWFLCVGTEKVRIEPVGKLPRLGIKKSIIIKRYEMRPKGVCVN